MSLHTCLNCGCRTDSRRWRPGAASAEPAWPRHDARTGLGLCGECASLTDRWDRGVRSPVLPCPTAPRRPTITVYFHDEVARVDAAIAQRLKVPDGYRFRNRNQFYGFLVDVSETFRQEVAL